MEWTNDICLKLIEEYQLHPALWDQSSPHYKNKLKRKESWALLSERFGCTKAEVERKMNVLLTQYRREKHKIMILQRYKNGEIRKNSRWYAFKKFAFMDGGFIPKKCALQLYGEMQMHLGLPHLQSNQILPNIAWNSSSHITDHHSNNINNNHFSSSNNHQNIIYPNINTQKYSDSIHQNRNNNNNSSILCPSVQDLSMNSSSTTQNKDHSLTESKSSNNINNNQHTDDEEIMEIHVDPSNIDRSSGMSNISAKNLSNNNNNNINGYADIKDEIFDDMSPQDYHAQDDEDEDDDRHPHHQNQTNDSYHPNDFISSSSNNNHQYQYQPNFRAYKFSRKRNNNYENNRGLNDDHNKPSTITSYRSSVNYQNEIEAIAEHVLKNRRDKDDCDLIGLNVALKLRAMEESQRIIAEKLISDVLFYGQFNELCRTANITPATTQTTSRQQTTDGTTS